MDHEIVLKILIFTGNFLHKKRLMNSLEGGIFFGSKVSGATGHVMILNYPLPRDLTPVPPPYPGTTGPSYAPGTTGPPYAPGTNGEIYTVPNNGYLVKCTNSSGDQYFLMNSPDGSVRLSRTVDNSSYPIYAENVQGTNWILYSIVDGYKRYLFASSIAPNLLQTSSNVFHWKLALGTQNGGVRNVTSSEGPGINGSFFVQAVSTDKWMRSYFIDSFGRSESTEPELVTLDNGPNNSDARYYVFYFERTFT